MQMEPLPAAQNAANWQSFLGGISQLGLDVARAKLIDVERVSDDNNMQDQADLRYAAQGAPALAGMTFAGVLLVVGLVAAGAFLLSRLK